MMRLLALVATVASATSLQGRGGAFSLVEKEAAAAGYGLPGCDKDTFIRYSLIFCGASGQEGKETKALKDKYFDRLLPDVKDFKKAANKELGWKQWRMDTINSNGFRVCHDQLGEFSPNSDNCQYQFKEEDAKTGDRVPAATDAATLFGV